MIHQGECYFFLPFLSFLSFNPNSISILSRLPKIYLTIIFTNRCALLFLLSSTQYRKQEILNCAKGFNEIRCYDNLDSQLRIIDGFNRIN